MGTPIAVVRLPRGWRQVTARAADVEAVKGRAMMRQKPPLALLGFAGEFPAVNCKVADAAVLDSWWQRAERFGDAAQNQPVGWSDMLQRRVALVGEHQREAQAAGSEQDRAAAAG